MTLKQAILDLARRHPFDDVDPEEAQTIVDFMALAVYADYEVHVYEEIELNELVTAMKASWSDDILEDRYVATALASAKEVVQQGRVAAQIRSLTAQLYDGRFPYLFEMLTGIVTADSEVTDTERAFLAEVAEAFGIDDGAAQLVLDTAIEQMD